MSTETPPSGGSSFRNKWGVPLALVSIPIALAVVGAEQGLTLRAKILLGLAVWVIALCCLSLIVFIADTLLARFWTDL
jgi:hypothetical protein